MSGKMHRALSSRPAVLFLATLVLLAAADALDAQVAGGAISGTVKDNSGAVVPGATVLIQNTRTKVTGEFIVDAKGYFRASNLLPGPYEVKASLAGFKTAVRPGVSLTVGAELVIDLVLEVGSLEQTVDVTATAPVVEMGTSGLSNMVQGTTVREMPLNGRDWTSLAQLEPGVTAVRNQPALNVRNNERSNRGLGTQLTVGGNRPQQNNYRLDGISVNDYSNGAPASVLGTVSGVDAVAEFSVLTNNAPAVYGRTSGGVVNAITRSGSNNWSGSAYEFHRNSRFDASNYFDTTPEPPPFHRNQFGGSVGGPIVKSRTFFFADYEGVRQILNSTQLAVVPTAAARAGQLVSGAVTVDQRIAPYLVFFPLPNGAIKGDTGVYSAVIPQDTKEDFFTARVDHVFSSRDNFFATYMKSSSKGTAPDIYQTTATSGLGGRDALILEETHMLGSHVVNSLRFGYNRSTSQAPVQGGVLNPRIQDLSYGFIPGKPVGTIAVTGLTRFDGGTDAVGEYDFDNKSYQVYDDLSIALGAHSFKVGAAFERVVLDQLGKASPSGDFIFPSLSTFLTNRPSTFTATLGGSITPRLLSSNIFGAYAQDDWRIRRNLTVNAGIRYEIASVPKEANGKLTNLDSPLNTVPRTGSPYFENKTKLNFAPRVGFSWDPFSSGKTAVRGAFGVYDELPLPYMYLLLTQLSAPFYQQGSIGSPGQGTFPSGAYSLLTPNKLRYAYVASPRPRAYVMQWNVNLQRELFKGLSAMVGYVGSAGRNLPYQESEVNFVQPTKGTDGYWYWPAAKNGTVLNPSLGQTQALVWDARSDYRALQFRVTQQQRHGIQFGVSYTYGHASDTGSSTSASGVFQNSVRRLWFDEDNRYGPADYDVRHNFVANFVWQVPEPDASGILGVLTRGWQVGGIYQASSGTPFTPAISGDPLGMKSAGTFDYPDRLTGPGCDTAVNPGSVTNYIKLECFAFPNPATRLGNAGRNSLVGPGLSNFDLSIVKNTKVPSVSDRFNVQVRLEVFNLFNRANFAAPLSNRTLFNATGGSVANAGLITATTTTARQLQLGLKLIW